MQPQVPVGVRAGNVPAPTEAWLPGLTPNGLANRYRPTTQGTLATKVTGSGVGANQTGSVSTKYSTAIADGQAAFSWHFIAYRDNSADSGTQSVVRKDLTVTPLQDVGAAGGVHFAVWPVSTGLSVFNYSSSADPFRGRANVFSGTYSPSLFGYVFNGTPIVTQIYQGVLQSGGAPFCFGGTETDGELAPAWTILGVAIWERIGLTQAQLQSLQDDPWQIFQ
jgi:hypothetical protein